MRLMTQKRGHVGNLMDTAKEELCKEARSLGCNAVLGMTFNISKDSAEQRGQRGEGLGAF